VDNVILGHISPFISNEKTMNTIRRFIRKCELSGIPIFSLDELADYFEDIPRSNYYSPQMDWGNKIVAPLGKLYRIDVPIIGVFGTSSKQGKFTLQLELRRRFLSDGYALKQIGTEPTSPLFGCDACYHFGFNAKMNIPHFEMVTYINYLMHELISTPTDLMLVGCQSATIPSDFSNLKNLAVQQLEYLIATQPDVVLLCINYNDTLDYVKRTIAAIESISEATVIGAAFLPIKQEILPNNQIVNYTASQDEANIFINLMSNKLSLPVYNIANEDALDKAYRQIIQELS
jgi:uncharacterized NAD-dependent epimerase/dehydratase family protein